MSQSKEDSIGRAKRTTRRSRVLTMKQRMERKDHSANIMKALKSIDNQSLRVDSYWDRMWRCMNDFTKSKGPERRILS